MGEATHGTHEFFTAKHRLIRFLVEKQGFSVIAFESNFAEAFAVNNATLSDNLLAGGADKVRTAVYRLGYPVWFTEEIVDLLTWLQQHNLLTPHKVLFAGIDLADAAHSTRIVRNFLASASLRGFSELDPSALAGKAPSKDWAERLELVRRLEPRLTGVFAPREVAWVIQNLRQVIWAGERKEMSIMGRNIGRDLYMAHNIGWLLDTLPSQTKIAVWSHNWHVAKLPGRLGGEMARSLGQEGYKSIGLAACAGNYNATDSAYQVKPHRLAEPPASSLEAWLSHAEADSGYLLLDEPGLAALRGPLLARTQQIGYQEVALEHQFAPEPLASQYDALVFFKQTSPSRLLGGKDLGSSAQ